MWRWAHLGGMFQIAQRLLPVLERELGMLVYPDQNTCWHYDDKVAQAYLFQALGILTPTTWCWFTHAAARDWIRSADFPLVLKLARGAGSDNIRLLQSAADAEFWAHRLFQSGTKSLEEPIASIHDAADERRPPWPWATRARAAAKALLKGQPLWQPPPEWPLEKNYVLFQEFLPNNEFDTRVTVIGRRAFAFRRLNREGDFRASGSGRLDYTPEAIDPQFVRLAFTVAKLLRAQSCAIDGLYRRGKVVVSEVSYTYVSSAVQACPGHWQLEGEADSGRLVWHAGSMWPEEAQIEGFLARLRDTAN